MGTHEFFAKFKSMKQTPQDLDLGIMQVWGYLPGTGTQARARGFSDTSRVDRGQTKQDLKQVMLLILVKTFTSSTDHKESVNKF